MSVSRGTSLGILLFSLVLAADASAGDSAGLKVSAALPVPRLSSDGRGQMNPAVAFDGKGVFLVVWQQGQKFFEGPGAAVLAARVSSGGKALDAKPIAFGPVKGTREAPRVAFSNGVFLVVWQDFRNGKDWDLYGVRLKPGGTLLDKSPFPIAAAPNNQALPSVAPAPGGFLVAWQDRRGGGFYKIYTAFVSAGGSVSPAGGRVLARNGKPLLGGEVHVVRAGNGCFMAWKDESNWSRGASKRTTRFVGRLAGAGGAWHLLESTPLPKGLFGLYSANLAGGTKSALLVTGGSRRSEKLAMAAVFDATTGQAKPNPNTSDGAIRAGASGWNIKQAIVLLEPLVPGYVPPIGVGSNGDEFLVVVRERAGRRRKGKSQASPLRLLRIGADGKKSGDTKHLAVLDNGQAPCSHPTVAGGMAGTYLVAYQCDVGPGPQRVVARIVRTR